MKRPRGQGVNGEENGQCRQLIITDSCRSSPSPWPRPVPLPAGLAVARGGIGAIKGCRPNIVSCCTVITPRDAGRRRQIKYEVRNKQLPARLAAPCIRGNMSRFRENEDFQWRSPT